MQKSRASFTVFFEDPFWVGVYEREEPGGLTACRVVFGAEPKDGEIYEWMLQNWAQLHFGPRWRMSGGPGRKTRSVPGAWPGAPLPHKAWERRRSRRWHWRAVPANRPVPPRAGNRSRRTGSGALPCAFSAGRKSTGAGKDLPLCFSDCRKK